MSVIIGFNDAEDVFKEFEGSTWDYNDKTVPEHPVDREDVTIIYANYHLEGYEGDAFVLFVQNGRLYEVSGSHCSCYGLEGQWSPDHTTVDSLQVRSEARTKHEWMRSPNYYGEALVALFESGLLANLEAE